MPWPWTFGLGAFQPLCLAQGVRAWVNARVSDFRLPAAAADRGRGRTVLARSVMVVVAWHVLPVCEVITGYVIVARRPRVDSLDSLVLAFHEVLLAASLVASLAVLGVLGLLARRWPRLRRVAVLGNISSVTGIVLSTAAVAWLFLWARS